MGSRVAEPSYDLFAVSMIMINTAYPSRFSKSGDGHHQLKLAITKHSVLRKYQDVLFNAISGKYSKATEMRRDLVTLMSRASVSAPPEKRNIKTQSNQTKIKDTRNQQRSILKKKKEKKGTVETLLILLFLLLAYSLYIYGQLI